MATTAESMEVTVGLADGSELSGRIRAFQPRSPEIFLDVSGGADDGLRRLPTELVAYVALHASASERRETHPGCEGPALRVHVGHHRSFVVRASDDPHDPVGFWGVPVDEAAGAERIFFFTHARKALERDETLGAMLIDQGAVAPADLERGLERQAALRRRRIGDILLDQKVIEPDVLDRGLDLQRHRRVRLGEVLVEAGLATSEDVEAALDEQRRHRGRRIGEILVEMGVVSERTLASTLAEKFHLPLVDLDECLIDPAAIASVPRWILEKHRILPIEVDEERITIALSDPLDTEAIDLVRFRHRRRVREVVAVPSQLRRYLADLLPDEEIGADELEIATLDHPLDAHDVGEESDDLVVLHESDNAIIHLANQIIVEAIRRGASDIHIEPNGSEGPTHVRFRVDGVCFPLPDVPATHRLALVSRLKIMAQLDIAERRRPQDGKIRIRLRDRAVELRVVTLPTIGGEDVVLRVLSSSKPYSFDELEFDGRDRRALEGIVSRPYGLLLCVGPTGSGKSTTLHALLGHINTPERKIWTAEDPVEISQPGLRQVPVRPRIGFGFAEALRSFLRADPDVIMIGEMRDQETARIAIDASLTGHLVLSTLHTNSAAETAVRLVEMGLDPLTFGDALLGILAQRLVRRLCESCRALEPVPEAELETLRRILGDDQGEVGQLLWRGRGCDACEGTGYRGRVALHELLVVDEALRLAIHGRAGADRIRELAMAGGMKTLLQQGARKCLHGTTDLRQVLSVCAR